MIILVATLRCMLLNGMPAENNKRPLPDTNLTVAVWEYLKSLFLGLHAPRARLTHVSATTTLASRLRATMAEIVQRILGNRKG
jgi:hypothetical protein